MAKGIQKKQVPVAIVLVTAVIIVIACILTFGGNKNEKIKTDNMENSLSLQKTSTHTSNNIKNKEDKKNKENKERKEKETTPKAPPPISTPAEYTTDSSIVISGTSAMEMYYISSNNLKRYAETINAFSTLVPKSQIYVMLAPTSIEFYGPKKFNTGSHSQKEGINIAYDALNDKIKHVDARSELRMHADEYLYFRTDHHWTARGAYYAYTAFANVAGFNPSKIDSYDTGKIDDFVGSMYRYTQAQVLKDNPDYVETFTPSTPAEGVIYSDPTMTDSRPLTIVANKVSINNKYLAFIQGDNPLIKITTNNKNGKKIILIKESYGNAFAPFLIDNYEEIYVTDPRRIEMNLADFVNTQGIDDVLFLNYTLVPSNPTYMEAFSRMLGQG